MVEPPSWPLNKPKSGKTDADSAMSILLASEPPPMEAYRVSRAVNTPRSNAEALLEPVTP